MSIVTEALKKAQKNRDKANGEKLRHKEISSLSDIYGCSR